MGTWVGRYAIVDGQVREHGPWLVDRRREREDETIRLLVLAEPADRRSAEFCSEVAEAVAALFARESLSITGGLLRALQQAHTNLAEWNRRSLREHRVAVGVTCVVIRDGEATIVQVGPGLAYVSGQHSMTRLSTEGLPAAAPLGGPDEIEPRFTATDISGREVLLLTSTVEEIIGLRQVEESLAAGPEGALAELFRRTRDVTDMTAVLVADLDIEDGGMPAPLDMDLDDIEGREVVLPDIDSGHRTAAPRFEAERAPEPTARRRWGPQSSQPIPFPSIRRPARTVGRTPLEAQLPWRWIALAVGALLAVGLLSWTIGPGLLTQDRAAELDKVLATAQQQLTTATAAQRADDRRKALQAVLAATEKARAIAPDDARVRTYAAQAQAELSKLDAVSDVGTATQLLKFEGTVTAPVNPQTVVVGGRSIWFVESDRGRVFRMDAAQPSTPEEVYRAGSTYGGTPARDPKSIAWDAQSGRLLLLDEGRSLFTMSETAKTPVPVVLRGAPELGSPNAIAVYQRSLYILDPGKGEIWKYFPASEGYDSERTGMLGGVDLGTATGLVVDGDVYVVDQGRLRRFRSGKETAPLLDGIDTPPKGPVALVEDLQRSLLFLADRGNKRIVVGDREGRFVRQYRNPSFGDLRGLAISADGSRLFLLSGDGISYFDVAPAGQPPVQPSGSPSASPSGTPANGASSSPTPPVAASTPVGAGAAATPAR